MYVLCPGLMFFNGICELMFISWNKIIFTFTLSLCDIYYNHVPWQKPRQERKVSGAPFSLFFLKVFVCLFFSSPRHGSHQTVLRPSPQRSPIRGICAGVTCTPYVQLSTTLSLILCSGSGPITIAPWTSQTPLDWAGGKESSDVWKVSSSDPEPARRPVHLPFPSQTCQPRLTQARRRSEFLLKFWRICCSGKGRGNTETPS